MTAKEWRHRMTRAVCRSDAGDLSELMALAEEIAALEAKAEPPPKLSHSHKPKAAPAASKKLGD